MRRWVGRGLVGLLLLLGVGSVGAQQLREQCKHQTANAQGVAGADVVVGVAAVTVIAADTSLCGAVITNTSNLNAVRCNVIGTEPTGTTGFKLLPYQVWGLDAEAQLGIRCIRDTTAAGDVSLTIWEYRP